MIIQAAIHEARELLLSSDSPQLDAELLLAFVLHKPREYLYTWPEKNLSEEEYSLFREFYLRREKGHPIAYLLGQRAFWDFDLKVNGSVLIPRPETELLVEIALNKLDAEQKLIADLGTGSGAIALALASERPQWQVLACDLSKEALEVAGMNLSALALSNVELKQGRWCEAFSESKLNAIISNPPYIDPEDEHLKQGDVRFEPELALVSAKNGLADIMIIAEEAQSRLKAGGWLMLEHGFAQGEAVRNILADLNYAEIETTKDLAGKERVTCGQRQV